MPLRTASSLVFGSGNSLFCFTFLDGFLEGSPKSLATALFVLSGFHYPNHRGMTSEIREYRNTLPCLQRLGGCGSFTSFFSSMKANNDHRGLFDFDPIFIF